MTETRSVDVQCSHCGDLPAGQLVVFRSAPDGQWQLGLVGNSRGDFTALTAELIDDRALPRFTAPEVATELDRWVGRRRERYRFDCERCGDNLPARHEKLAVCAEKLAGHGESRVSMTTLRRMLKLV